MNSSRPPIIAFAPHPWEEPQWMNRQHLLHRLAKRGWPVFYGTGVLCLWQRHSNNWKVAPLLHRIRTVDQVNLIDSGKLYPEWAKSATVSRFARSYYASFIKRQAGIRPGQPFICLSFHPRFQPIIGQLAPTLLHSHTFDLYWKMGLWNDLKQQELETQLSKCRLITASSPAMVEELQAFTTNPVHCLPNGVDLQLFDVSRPPCPADLAAISSPRIANIGTLNSKLDVHCLAELATTHPQWNFVFVGRIEEAEMLNDGACKDAYLALKNSANVYFLGEKDRREIPAYAHNMDVLTVCYQTRSNSWAKGGYPLKLHESLATGVPVISTAISVVQEQFSHVALVADGADAWSQGIQDILAHGGASDPDSRRQVARENSWNSRVDELEARYLKLLAST